MNHPSYICPRGKTFEFNAHVVMECTPLPIEDRTGRLVQVRKGCGQFGSDVYFIRRRCGNLIRGENVMLRHVGDRAFEDAYYLHGMGCPPPEIPDQPIYEGDTPETEYTHGKGKYPETGFIIEHPAQPSSPVQSFALTISTPTA